VPVRVCIDDVRALDGFRQLRTYRSDELYRVDLFDGGKIILVYTKLFMERAAAQGPLPVSPTPELAC
jgi:hypothetical protein